MQALISQPTHGKTSEEIGRAYVRAGYALGDKGYETADPLSPQNQVGGHPGLAKLARAIQCMANCQAVYFCEGWERDAQCQIEHVIALRFGLKVIEEETTR